MNDKPAWKYPLTLVLIAFCVCTIMALFYALFYHYDRLSEGLDANLFQEILHCLIWYWPYTILFFIAMLTYRWAPFVIGKRLRAVLIHLFAGILSAFVFRYYGVYAYRNWFDTPDMPYMNVGAISLRMLHYWMLLGCYMGIDYYTRYKERLAATSRLKVQLAQAQLSLLKRQLQPHFIFNTLNAISTLMRDDLDAAEEMLEHLGDLLRISIDRVGLHEVALCQEIEFLKRYLKIEQIRFGERLRVEFDAPREALDGMVPYLILQPIVENAVTHGIGKTARGGIIKIKASRNEKTLTIAVSDNGPGLLDGESIEGNGVGLANTQERLKQLYADQAAVDPFTPEGGGFGLRLTIPYHEAPLDFEGAEDREP